MLARLICYMQSSQVRAPRCGKGASRSTWNPMAHCPGLATGGERTISHHTRCVRYIDVPSVEHLQKVWDLDASEPVAVQDCVHDMRGRQNDKAPASFPSDLSLLSLLFHRWASLRLLFLLGLSLKAEPSAAGNISCLIQSHSRGVMRAGVTGIFASLVKSLRVNPILLRRVIRQHINRATDVNDMHLCLNTLPT
ncbi:hypothetical protein HDV57DRAFT_400209 [Trichoderma longibrachiatum]|uniref:Uncharacterized protein n=1 Tax=Trichoderma longibrachiatum ATCC 18648 TaxID=983965 RepID=A0A2T4C1P7_TRILO|nr:hypothetical protein M440DRAFT_1255483 [Trichoderma longibrachiatum ATCC 18648]